MNSTDTGLNTGLDFQETANKLTITKSWKNNNTISLSLFGIFIAGFCGYLSFFFLEDVLFNNLPLGKIILKISFGLFPLLFAFAGILLVYFGLAGFLNKSSVIIENNLLQIKQGPLPLQKSQTLSKENIRQIYVRGAQSLDKSYRLDYIDNNGQSRPLFGSFLTLNFPSFSLWEAKEIERRIEGFMGIADQPVFGADAGSISQKVEGEIYPNEKTVEHATLLPYPETLLLEETNDELYIFKKWQSPRILFFIIITLFVNTMSWQVALNSILTTMNKGGESWMMAIFALPFMVLGIWMIGVVLAILLNTSTFHINSKELIIQSGPIPIFKNYKLQLSEIVGFEALTKTRKTKNNVHYYKVLALNLTQGRQIELKHNSMMSLSDEEVLFLQEKLSKFLK